MKKLIAFIGLFAMVLVALPFNVAHASTGVTDTMVEQAIERNYGIDNVLIAKYVDGKYYLFIELDANKSPSAPYDVDRYTNSNWRVTWDNASGAYFEKIVSPSYWHCRTIPYDEANQKWSDSYSSQNYQFALDEYEIVYASKDVMYSTSDHWGELSGTVFFKGAPHLTKLAKIVEQSSRQQTPMYQVISLMPLAIFLVVSFLSLRKCLQMLRTILSGA